MVSSSNNNQKWKVLFFILLALNIIGIGVIGYTVYPLFAPVSEPTPSHHQTQPDMEAPPFYIHATKETITESINQYTTNFDEPFTILLDDYVEFATETSLFGMDVSIHATFEPIVEQDGNLLLKQQTISFGILQIPNEYALQYIAHMNELPDWIIVHPKQELIYIDIKNAPSELGVAVQFEQFNLKEDEIIMRLYVDKPEIP